MSIKLKKSLGGYNPSIVERELVLLKDEFEKEKKNLENELSVKKEECNNLQMELELITEKIESLKSIETKVGDMLLKAHMEATSSVYESIKKFKTMEKEKIKQLEEHLNKRKELDEEIDRLKEDIQSIVNG